VVRTPGGVRLLLPPGLARAVGSGVELALLEHIATAPALPDGWVDIDRAQVAGALGTSLANLRRALGPAQVPGPGRAEEAQVLPVEDPAGPAGTARSHTGKGVRRAETRGSLRND
jgi:hypothetical protein